MGTMKDFYGPTWKELITRLLDEERTEQEIADVLGVSQASVNAWKQGDGEPYPKRQARYRKILEEKFKDTALAKEEASGFDDCISKDLIELLENAWMRADEATEGAIQAGLKIVWGDRHIEIIDCLRKKKGLSSVHKPVSSYKKVQKKVA